MKWYCKKVFIILDTFFPICLIILKLQAFELNVWLLIPLGTLKVLLMKSIVSSKNVLWTFWCIFGLRFYHITEQQSYLFDRWNRINHKWIVYKEQEFS